MSIMRLKPDLKTMDLKMDLKNAKTVLNILELIFSVTIGGLIADLTCIGCITGDFSRNQAVDGIVYGFSLVSFILCVSIVISEPIAKNVRSVIAATGCILWTAASALLLEHVSRWSSRTVDYDRLLAAGILGLATALAYLADLYVVSKEG